MNEISRIWVIHLSRNPFPAIELVKNCPLISSLLISKLANFQLFNCASFDNLTITNRFPASNNPWNDSFPGIRLLEWLLVAFEIQELWGILLYPSHTKHTPGHFLSHYFTSLLTTSGLVRLKSGNNEIYFLGLFDAGNRLVIVKLSKLAQLKVEN